MAYTYIYIYIVKKYFHRLNLQSFRVQVRRTDKRKEAGFYDIEEYMLHVKNFYKQYSLLHPSENFVKSVYLATDEPRVFSEAKTKLVLFENVLCWMFDLKVNALVRNTSVFSWIKIVSHKCFLTLFFSLTWTLSFSVT